MFPLGKLLTAWSALEAVRAWVLALLEFLACAIRQVIAGIV
jgi:hypothetical protein